LAGLAKKLKKKSKISRKEGLAYGANPGFAGKIHSLETKSKISKTNSIALLGENNPNFGNRNIFKEGITMKVHIMK
jgi:hypothetical protein